MLLLFRKRRLQWQHRIRQGSIQFSVISERWLFVEFEATALMIGNPCAFLSSILVSVAGWRCG